MAKVIRYMTRPMHQRLVAFREVTGKTWKSKLRKLWTSGQDEGEIRHARNVIGPTDLDTVDLEEGTYKAWMKGEASRYPEVHVDSHQPANLPLVCPKCGCAVIDHTDIGKPWERIVYACGGAYRSKPQIQNHTDKWWGHCGQK